MGESRWNPFEIKVDTLSASQVYAIQREVVDKKVEDGGFCFLTTLSLPFFSNFLLMGMKKWIITSIFYDRNKVDIRYLYPGLRVEDVLSLLYEKDQ